MSDKELAQELRIKVCKVFAAATFNDIVEADKIIEQLLASVRLEEARCSPHEACCATLKRSYAECNCARGKRITELEAALRREAGGE